MMKVYLFSQMIDLKPGLVNCLLCPLTVGASVTMLDSFSAAKVGKMKVKIPAILNSASHCAGLLFLLLRFDKRTSSQSSEMR